MWRMRHATTSVCVRSVLRAWADSNLQNVLIKWAMGYLINEEAEKICLLKLQPQLVFSRGWTSLLAALMRCSVSLSHGIEKILSESSLLFIGVALWRCTVWFYASSDSDSCSDWCNQRLLSGCSYSEGPPPPLLCGSSSFL